MQAEKGVGCFGSDSWRSHDRHSPNPRCSPASAWRMGRRCTRQARPRRASQPKPGPAPRAQTARPGRARVAQPATSQGRRRRHKWSKEGAQMAQKTVQKIVLKKKTPQQFYTPGTAAIHKLALKHLRASQQQPCIRRERRRPRLKTEGEAKSSFHALVNTVTWPF